MKTALCLVALSALTADVMGHGRLLKPPHRGFIGRLPGYQFVPINYSDNGLSAGGVGATKDGLHGVCGDPYTDKVPRPHESGGFYGTFPTHGSAAIAACYAPGSTVQLSVQLTANHIGFFEFDLCKLNNKGDVETESCFQPLVQPNGKAKWNVPLGVVDVNLQYVLPKDVTCEGDSHCVLRWHYTGGNNWTREPNASVWVQEHFWNCADIYISNTCGVAPPTTSTPPRTTSTPTTTTSTLAPTTSTPTTSTPAPVPTTTPSPGDQCNGNRNVCYWPATQQVIPYSKADCALFPSFVWCP